MRVGRKLGTRRQEFRVLYIVCFLIVVVILLWWKRRYGRRSLTRLSALIQRAPLLLRSVLKIHKPLNVSFIRGNRNGQRTRKYVYLVFFFLLVSICVVLLTIGHRTGTNVDKDIHKIGFHRVQTRMERVLGMNRVALWQVLKPLEQAIKEWFEILPCKEDKSLLLQQPIQERVLIAATLVNCAELMPNFILQLLKFIALFEEDRIRVSIFESGSEDLTPSWLILLKRILLASNITNSITIDGDLTEDLKEDSNKDKGGVKSGSLVELKNKAIAPMVDWSGGSRPWRAKKVVFINNVYFCPQHILRLLLHKKEDVVCGMDFSSCLHCLPSTIQQPYMIRDLERRFYMLQRCGFYIAKVEIFRKLWRWRLRFSDFLRLKIPMVFHSHEDTLDLEGVPFSYNSPYMLESGSNESLIQGYPVYVHSCWSGLVILNAKPLYQGLRFRRHYDEECELSEGFQLCQDYTQLGFDRIMVDPGVRLASHYQEAIALYQSQRILDLKFIPWNANGIRDPDSRPKPHPTKIKC